MVRCFHSENGYTQLQRRQGDFGLRNEPPIAEEREYGVKQAEEVKANRDAADDELQALTTPVQKWRNGVRTTILFHNTHLSMLLM